MMRKNQNKGFSLIEVVIVLAISAGLLVIVGGFYAQRRNVASDDEVRQVVSSLQTVQSEALNGLGPTGNTGASNFTSGETFYGEAVEFSNGAGCANNTPCMIVHKLKASPDGTNFSEYEQYLIPTTQNLFYFVGPNAATQCNDTTFFRSCLTTTNSRSVDFTSYWIVFRNGGNQSFFMNTAVCSAASNLYRSNCNNASNWGDLRQAVADSSTTPVQYRYYLNFTLGNSTNIDSSKQ